MDELLKYDKLLYFTNNDISSDEYKTIGMNIVNKKIAMWFKERSEIPTRASIKEHINNYYVLWFCEFNSTCICSSKSIEYNAIITLNTDLHHKATYKLNLFELDKGKSIDKGIYYSYFA